MVLGLVEGGRGGGLEEQQAKNEGEEERVNDSSSTTSIRQRERVKRHSLCHKGEPQWKLDTNDVVLSLLVRPPVRPLPDQFLHLLGR